MAIEKSNLIRLSGYLWEIPKSFRNDMLVPARIYATDKMLEGIGRDRSLEQLVNVTTLLGIQKHALVMPDAHEGYGFPIGGVAVTSYPDGVISPGGIGYDINCLHPETRLSLSFGSYLPIKNLNRSWRNFSVYLINKKARTVKQDKIINFLNRKENKAIYDIKTKFGFSVRATGDHPLYTSKGMKKTEDLKVGEKVITYPFSGVEYSEPGNRELMTRQKIIAAFSELKLSDSGNRRSQLLRWFEKKNLLNIRCDSSQTPYLIKAIGFLFGDGAMNLVGKDRRGLVSFYGKKEDLLILKHDLSQIGIKGQIYSRKKLSEIRSRKGKIYKFARVENRFQIKSTALVILFYLLGVPLGNKTNKKFSVPSWINCEKSPLWHKRLFLASFFGAEMSTPKTLNKCNFYLPTLNINKSILLKKNGEHFLENIKTMLNEFGINSFEVREIKGLGKENSTTGLRFQISGTPENLISFFQKIGFEYNKRKQKLAYLAVSYLKFKQKVLILRENTRQAVRILYRQKVPAMALRNKFESAYTPAQFIEHSVWQKERDVPRTAFDFISFDEFSKQYQYGSEGFVVDEIESIEKKQYDGLVYDITVNHPDHNFIADNVVVSNCGVRLLKSKLNYQDVKDHLENLANELYREIPSGVGRGGKLKLETRKLDEVLSQGVKWAVKEGFGEAEDLNHIESQGSLSNADPAAVSEHAKNRGRDQLGTLGAGNHFLEIDRVEQVFDEEHARAFGLSPNQIVILIHTGSRGLGHQVATDYIRIMNKAMPRYGITVPDRELVCVPLSSPEGTDYFNAMAAAANFAWTNRQLIMAGVRKIWKNVLGNSGGKLSILYDVAHNIAKIEDHEIDGKIEKVIVHRKGATRAFGPGHPDLIEEYQKTGQPVIIPGSMGTASYVLVGTEKAMEESFGSTCHGAGRAMSRHAAKRQVYGEQLKRELEKEGILIRVGSVRGLAEEAPIAYKDVHEVVDVVHQAGIATKVARLRPLVVIKG